MDGETIRAAVITVSTAKASGETEDRSGRKLAGELEGIGAEVQVIEVVPDERDVIAGRLRHWVEQEVDVVATCGGVGLVPDDMTPEATFEVMERYIPGLVEAMRAVAGSNHPDGWLSRAVAGVADRTLLINFPADPLAIGHCFAAVAEAIPRAVAALHDNSTRL